MAIGYFGQNLLQGFSQSDWVKDYSHAAKTFQTNGYQLAPRYKFLFHVYFNINTGQIPQLAAAYGDGEIATIGLMAKTVDLPSYQISVDTMNQYNRKRLVQTKIEYQPVSLTLHDDTSDLIRNMWYQYYTYYYKDPSQPYKNIPAQSGTSGQQANKTSGFGYNNRDIYDQSRPVADWGYVGESYTDGTQQGTGQSSYSGKPPFFRDIQIYGLSQKKYAEYVLINPMITDWKSDQYDYSQTSGTMQHSMTIKYETVKYYSGAIGGAFPSNAVSGFGDPAHYDTSRSSLARPGSTTSVFGQGGLIDAAAGITQDLQSLASGQGGLQNIIGAVQTASTAYNTFKGKSLASIATQDIQAAAPGIIRGSLPGAMRSAISTGNGMFFPPKDSGSLG